MRLAGDLGLPPEGYQGNWIPHQLRPAVEDGVFFAGDSAGHCLPLTAEGIRTALYFGLACGRELRAVVEGRRTREQALRATAPSRTRTPGSSTRCSASSGWCRECHRGRCTRSSAWSPCGRSRAGSSAST